MKSASLLMFLRILGSFALTVPILHNPLKLQLVASNPALSSVYFPLPSSPLLYNMSKSAPALRVPPNWSFSIGLSGDTFLPGEGDSSDDLSLFVQLKNGDPVPHWLRFDSSIMTLDGIAPPDDQSNTIMVMASVGNVSMSDSFILIISPHDMAITTSFKSRNITTGLPFSFVINDLENIIIDNSPLNTSMLNSENRISPTNFNFSLGLDTAAFPWMSWDSSAFSLHGTGPLSEGHHVLPITASAFFPNQHLSLRTNLTLNVFTSYFNISWLPPRHILPGSLLKFDLTPFSVSEARNDPEWTLSINGNSSTSWIAFDPARLSLEGTVPQNITDNLQITVVAQHTVHNLTNRIFLDLIVDQDGANTDRVKGKRLSHPTLGKVLKGVLGVGVAVLGVIVIALISAYILSKRRTLIRGKEQFGVAYSYKEPASKDSRRPVQRVFDNFSISSSPGMGGRLTATRAVFDAIRNRLRGEKLAYTRGLSRNNQQRRSPNLFGKKSQPVVGPVTHNSLPQRPRKSKIGRPIAILNGSTGLFSDFIAGNLPRTVSFRQAQESQPKEDIHTFSKIPPSRFSLSCPQFTQDSQSNSNIPLRPPNPVLKLTPVALTETSSNDTLPTVPPKLSHGSSRMKAGDFLANKRRATSRAHDGTSGSMSSTTMDKARPRSHEGPLKFAPRQASLPAIQNGNNPGTIQDGRARTVRPHFGESSLESIKEMNGPSTSNDSHLSLNRSADTRQRNVIMDQLRHREQTKQSFKQPLDSPNPSSEEYFGSASNESVVQGRKPNERNVKSNASVAITLPSMYSDNQHPTPFPISSYSIAARQPFAFIFDAKSKADHSVSYIAKQHNGADLPPWLHFDKTTNEFWGVTPDVEKKNTVNVEIDIWDPRTGHVIAGTDVEVWG